MQKPLPFPDAVNQGLSRAWKEGWWPEPTLDAGALIREACKREGAESIPGQHWREPFEQLLAGLFEHARLNPIGRQIANGQLVTLLRMRIRAERLLRREPEILAREIHAPVIIVGHMRSGTTRLHRLLAQDPRFVHTRQFETLEPVPRRGRRLRAAAVNSFLHALNPELAAVHPSAPLQAEEEYGLHSFSWAGAQFEAQWRLPAFAALARRRDMAVPYGEFATLLNIIGWSRRESPTRTWLLKSPQFMGDLSAVLDRFPDARLLCLARDPAAVVGSSASLVWHQRRIQSDAADKHQIGAEWLEKTLWRDLEAAAVRRARPEVPQLSIGFDEVSADWEAAIRRIYGFLELPLTVGVLTRMRRYMEQPSPHTRHRYTLAEFGLKEDKVRRLFGQARIEPRTLRRPSQDDLPINALALAQVGVTDR